MRNEIIFNGKFFYFWQLIDIIKLKIVSWFKAKWPDGEDNLMEVVRFSNLIKVPLRVKPVRDVTSWKNPPLDLLKLMWMVNLKANLVL